MSSQQKQMQFAACFVSPLQAEAGFRRLGKEDAKSKNVVSTQFFSFDLEKDIVGITTGSGQGQQ